MKKCSDLKLLDYAYGISPEKERNAVESHLVACDPCRGHLDDIRKVIAYVECARDEFVMVDIHDIHADGSSTTYGSWKERNTTGKQSRRFDFGSMKYHEAQSILIDGEEAPFQVSDRESGEYNTYDVQLNHPLATGESASVLYVYGTASGIGAAIDIGFGRWVAVPDNSGGDDDTMLVQMVRLPEGGKLLGSVLPSDEIREGLHTTLVWRRLVKSGEVIERPVVVYSL